MLAAASGQELSHRENSTAPESCSISPSIYFKQKRRKIEQQVMNKNKLSFFQKMKYCFLHLKENKTTTKEGYAISSGILFLQKLNPPLSANPTPRMCTKAGTRSVCQVKKAISF